MSRKKKWSGILLTATMLAGLLAGCGGNNNAENGGNANGGANAGANGGNAGGDSLEPITFSFYGADENPNWQNMGDRKSTRLNSSHIQKSRMPSSA